jgi:hypothetical protein
VERLSDPTQNSTKLEKSWKGDLGHEGSYRRGTCTRFNGTGVRPSINST